MNRKAKGLKAIPKRKLPRKTLAATTQCPIKESWQTAYYS